MRIEKLSDRFASFLKSYKANIIIIFIFLVLPFIFFDDAFRLGSGFADYSSVRTRGVREGRGDSKDGFRSPESHDRTPAIRLRNDGRL